MLRSCRIISGSVVLLAAVLFPPPLLAQDSSLEGAPVRLRHIEGTVSVQRADAGEVEAGIVNLPLDAGDRLWTAEDGRAELLFEDGSVLWLDRRTTVDLVGLAGGASGPTTIVRLWSGSAYLARPDAETSRYGLSALRVDAPAGSAVVGYPGLYRLDVDDAQRLWLSTYDGHAELVAEGVREGVAAGRQSYAGVDTAPARPLAFNTAEEDAFASWRADRHASLYQVEHYVAARSYVSPSIVHHTVELRGHGSWSYYPAYRTWGWRPRVASGWSPYRHGRWVYSRRGWCWIPRHSWGYVTVHYGRWHHDGGRWIWFPGHRWSPAWVQWYVGAGHVGWVPLNYFNRPVVSFNVFIKNTRVKKPHIRDFARSGGHPDRRRGAARLAVGADGSARGGRVVDGLGFTAGAGDAWTFVPSDRLGSESVDRIAVAGAEAARNLQTGSRALIAGPLKPRQPEAAVPRRAIPAHADPSPGIDGASPIDIAPATSRAGYRVGAGTVTRPAVVGDRPDMAADRTARQATLRGDRVDAQETSRAPVARPGIPATRRPGQPEHVATRRAMPRGMSGVRSPTGEQPHPVAPLTRGAIAPRRVFDNDAIPRASSRAAPRSRPAPDPNDAIRRALPRSDRGHLRPRAVVPGPARAPVGQGSSSRPMLSRRPTYGGSGDDAGGSSSDRRRAVRVRPSGGDSSSGVQILPRTRRDSRVLPPRASLPRLAAPRARTGATRRPGTRESRGTAVRREARSRGDGG